ncbi:5-oxoprolinase subunit PxpB, partial [Cohnella xylanilytica]
MGEWTIAPLGDAGFALRPRGYSRDRLPSVLAEAASRCRRVPWITDAVHAYDSVTVYADWREPDGREDGRSPEEAAAFLLETVADIAGGEFEGRRTVVLPVYYGGEDGPDLASAAERSGLTEERFVELHSGTEYDVAMIGFAPGFPYLAGMPEELAQPRRPNPRKRVPAGSVGIAGVQTGVYPVDSPGGWQIIGRTPVRLFRPESEEPFPLRAGDKIRFQPVRAREAEPDSYGDREEIAIAGKAGTNGKVEREREQEKEREK